ncbi:MAG: VTT domain-containing protein [Planctomycetes bacterium]|nr:VTT domain-containing protein [Planctomycetota bacterium]MBL7039034.1 VTT domain-containing protein [Pirellulaceae bacterium]
MNRTRILRLVLLAVLIAALVCLVRLTGFSEHLTTDNLKPTVQQAGLWGIVLYYVAFSLGLLVHAPGMAFVAVGIFAYGWQVGTPLSFVGAVFAVGVNFLFARIVGGRALGEIEHPKMKRVLAGLDARPIRTVIILRLLFLMLPLLNYALAFSNIRFRDYLVGSAIGLAPHVLVASVIFKFVYWSIHV